MNSEVQMNKSSTAKSNSQRHMSGMHNYSQSGRTYQSEQYTGPLDRRTKILPKEERKRKTDETVRPQNLRAVEKFLGRKTNNPTAEIVKTFHLTPHPSGLQYSSGMADEVFKIPESNSSFASLLTIIPAQLLAYYCAIQKGFDPDKPRNLAKSVTVE